MIALTACGVTYADPLEDYLTKPPAIEMPPWREDEAPEKMIPIYQQRFNDEKSPSRAKGIALANLAYIARQMSQVESARLAAADLLERIVMPNLDYTRKVEPTNACSWRQTLMSCKNTYQNLGNSKAAQKCLILFRDEIQSPDDKDLAIYLLAYEYAKTEEYQTSIETIQSLAPDSRFAKDRQKLINYWSKKKIEAERKAKDAEQKQKKSEQKPQ